MTKRKNTADTATTPPPGTSSVSSGDSVQAAQAQSLMREALTTRSRRKRIALATEALAHAPTCAEAQLLLAEEAAPTLESALTLYEEAASNARLAIAAHFERSRGNFWQEESTHTFLRATAGLAHCLWNLDRREESVRLFQELVALDPADHLCVISTLIPALIELKHYPDASAALARSNRATSTPLAFSHALLSFLTGADPETALDAVKAAFAQNSYFLQAFQDFAQSRFERRTIGNYTLGTYEEAYAYIQKWYASWLEPTTDGTALAWLIRLGDSFARKRTVFEIFPDLNPEQASLRLSRLDP